MIDTWPKDLNIDFTLGNCLFGAPEVTKNADLKKYANSGYGIRFDTCSEFLLPDDSFG